MALASLAVLLAGAAAYGLWQLLVPGLSQIHPWLPQVVGWAVLLLILSLLSGVVGIVLAILGFPTIRVFYFWAWHIINFLYPLSLFLGKLMGISKRRVEQSFIEVSNHLVRNQHVRVPANRLLILTPHCIQLDTCPYKVTRDITNCHQCGRCGVGQLLALSKKYGVHVAIATGGAPAPRAGEKGPAQGHPAGGRGRGLSNRGPAGVPPPGVGGRN